MNKFIAYSLWILLIVCYKSYGLDDGIYTLDAILICSYAPKESIEQIVKVQQPQLHKRGNNYSITYENYGNKSMNFKVTQIMTMIKYIVHIETEDDNITIILDFTEFDIAQKFCKHHEQKVDLMKRKEYDLLAVLEMDVDAALQMDINNFLKQVMSKGQLLIDPFPTDALRRFTIIQSDTRLPHFIFNSHHFNVSEIRVDKEFTLDITIDMNGNECEYILKFATLDEATSFHKLVTREKHVEPDINM